MRLPSLFAAMLVSASVTAQASTPSPLEDPWGAPGAILTLSAEGGRIEEGCSLIELGSLHFDGPERFSAEGRYTTWGGGPQLADDSGGAGQPVAITGRIDGDIMHLNVTGQGVAPRELQFRRGLRAKVVRCL